MQRLWLEFNMSFWNIQTLIRIHVFKVAINREATRKMCLDLDTSVRKGPSYMCVQFSLNWHKISIMHWVNSSLCERRDKLICNVIMLYIRWRNMNSCLFPDLKYFSRIFNCVNDGRHSLRDNLMNFRWETGSTFLKTITIQGETDSLYNSCSFRKTNTNLSTDCVIEWKSRRETQEQKGTLQT